RSQKRIAQIDDDGATETIRYQYDNHLGSASLELDRNAAIISYEEYHPFGTTSYRSGRTETEVSLKRYKYVGKERDEETGLYYYGARYYAAWIGRWTAVDPLKEKYLHLSPYSYVANNPMKFIDPDGRKIVWADDENTKNTRVKVNELVQKSMIFATLYNYLDNLPKEINVSTNDEILQEKYQKATEGKDPTTKVGGVTSPDGREIIFSEITSKNNAYVEEFLHSFQTNFYKEPRNSQEKDAEAKLLNTVVAVEIEQNEIKSKGKQKVIDATKIFFSPGLISYNGVFALLIEEASKTGLIVKQGTVAALEYFKYLKVFEKEKEGTVYEGKQREVLPEAYNKIIELTK
ncbi:MAG: RHS repeat-associated core domain-containing protein, partial [Salinivirgaceae bacterium]|nr:RHS repeat-associated core domain-containing protein [Salinivirgaceae bacterium]